MDLYNKLESWHLYSCCLVFLKWVNMHWSVGLKSRQIISEGITCSMSSFRVLLTTLVSHSQFFQGLKDLSLRWCSWELSRKSVLVGKHSSSFLTSLASTWVTSLSSEWKPYARGTDGTICFTHLKGTNEHTFLF